MNSEASSKKRGRPEVFSEEQLELALRAGVAASRRVRSKRGAQDLVYRIRAAYIIEEYRRIYPSESEPLKWLFYPGDMRGETWRHSLLTELGRARTPQQVVAAAIYIANRQPPTKAGIRMIRRVRKAFQDQDAQRTEGREAT